MRFPRPGAFALLGLAALFLLLTVSVTLAGTISGDSIAGSTIEQRRDRLIVAAHVQMDVGDTLQVYALPSYDPATSPTTLELFILPGGGAAAVIAGQPPSGAYAHLTPDQWADDPSVEIERDARATTRGAWRFDARHGVDVVWVLRGDTEGLEFGSIRGDVFLASEAMHMRLVVIPTWFPPVQAGVLAAAAGALALGLIAAFAWHRRREEASAEPTGALSDLVALARRAEDHLRALRAAMLALGVALAVIGVVGGIGVHEGLRTLNAFKPWSDWDEDVQLLFILAYAFAVLLWAAQTWRIHREVVRWTRARAKDPLA